MQGTESGKTLSFASLALALADDYTNLYVINAEDDSYIEYVPSGENKELVIASSGKNFYEDVPRNCRELVFKEDQAEFLKTFSRENVMDALESGRSFMLNYRLVIDGVPVYYSLKTIRSFSDQSIIIGVRNVDKQTRRENKAKELSRTYDQIAGSLASRYEVIYYVDMETDNYLIYSASDEFSEFCTTVKGKDFFADAERDIKQVICSEDRDRILRALKKEKVSEALKKTGSVSFSYCQHLGGREQYMEMLIVRTKNDDRHVVIGVANVDEQVRHEQEVAKETQTFSDISTALAQRYAVIYHVNVVTNHYTEYSTAPEYSWVKKGTEGDSFFEECEENMKTAIYEDDLGMMLVAMKKENVLNTIATFGQLNLTYRLVVDGEARYVALYAVRAAEDSDYIIIAVSNVDKVKRMELALSNAVEMVGRDSLTGVKSKHAYVEAEEELDSQIGNSTQPEFAIVMCDLNGLKEVNDFKGHKAGDEYIRSASAIICNSFSHSPVFRIGGDEFAVILKGRDYDCRGDLIDQMIKKLEETKNNGLKLFAFGISKFDPAIDIRVQDVFERADRLMYKDKEECKKAIR